MPIPTFEKRVLSMQISIPQAEYPKLWKQLMLYEIMPSHQVVEDIKFMMSVDSLDDVRDYEFDHEFLMQLKRNQVGRGITQNIVDKALKDAKRKENHRKVIQTDVPSFPKVMFP